MAMPTTSRSVGSLLSSVPGLKAISVQLGRLAAMQHLCEQALPYTLRRRVMVVHEDGKSVLLKADGGATAAKVRHLTPRLLAAIRARFPTIERVRCEAGIVQRAQVPEGPVRRIQPTGRSALAGLAGSLPAGELRSALERLLERQRRSDRQDQSLEREEGETDRSHE